MRWRSVKNLLGGIESKTIKMIFADPIRQEKFADRCASFPSRLNGSPPLSLITIRKIAGREKGEVIPIGPNVVVNDVKNHSDAELVTLIYKVLGVLGLAVQNDRREETNTVVAPAEFPGNSAMA